MMGSARVEAYKLVKLWNDYFFLYYAKQGEVVNDNDNMDTI